MRRLLSSEEEKSAQLDHDFVLTNSGNRHLVRAEKSLSESLLIAKQQPPAVTMRLLSSPRRLVSIKDRVDILIVDEQRLNAAMLKRMIERVFKKVVGSKVKLSVALVEKREDVLAMISSDTFKIVFMDEQLLGVSGGEMACEIREMQGINQPLIIYMTADTSEAWLELDMDGTLVKPVTTETVEKCLAGLQYEIETSTGEGKMLASCVTRGKSDDNKLAAKSRSKSSTSTDDDGGSSSSSNRGRPRSPTGKGRFDRSDSNPSSSSDKLEARKRRKFLLPVKQSPEMLEELNHVNVLVVEDHKLNKLMLVRMLKRILPGVMPADFDGDIKVDSCANGKEAVSMVKKKMYAYAIIFMDLSMPVMDGVEATRRIRKLKNIVQPVIIATSANVEVDWAAKGMDDLLAKPITREKLKRLLRERLCGKTDVFEEGNSNPSLSVSGGKRSTGSLSGSLSTSAALMSPGRKVSLLVVDDVKARQDQLVSVLKKTKWPNNKEVEIFTASETDQACEQLEKRFFYIVFLAPTDNFSFVGVVRKMDILQPVIIATTEDESLDWAQLGMNGMIKVPAGMKQVEELIRKRMGRGRAARDLRPVVVEGLLMKELKGKEGKELKEREGKGIEGKGKEEEVEEVDGKADGEERDLSRDLSSRDSSRDLSRDMSRDMSKDLSSGLNINAIALPAALESPRASSNHTSPRAPPASSNHTSPRDKSSDLSPLMIRSISPQMERKDLEVKSEVKKEEETPSSYHILVVEDHKLNNIMLTRLIHSIAPKVSSNIYVFVDAVSNGQEAVTAVKSKTEYDLVFMDVSMPVMDGMEATARIRKMKKIKQPTIIATSANVDVDWKRNGMDGMLAKPIITNNLRKIMTENMMKQEKGRAKEENE